jgi:hypothetical protein
MIGVSAVRGRCKSLASRWCWSRNVDFRCWSLGYRSQSSRFRVIVPNLAVSGGYRRMESSESALVTIWKGVAPNLGGCESKW